MISVLSLLTCFMSEDMLYLGEHTICSCKECVYVDVGCSVLKISFRS